MGFLLFHLQQVNNMNTAYLLFILITSTQTNTPIGAQTFELQNASECNQMREYAMDKFKGMSPEVNGMAACFKQLGGKSKGV